MAWNMERSRMQLNGIFDSYSVFGFVIGFWWCSSPLGTVWCHSQPCIDNSTVSCSLFNHSQFISESLTRHCSLLTPVYPTNPKVNKLQLHSIDANCVFVALSALCVSIDDARSGTSQNNQCQHIGKPQRRPTTAKWQEAHRTWINAWERHTPKTPSKTTLPLKRNELMMWHG